MDILITAVAGCLTFAWKIHRKSNETQVIGRCERVMIRHDIVGVRKEKVILIVTGPFPFGLVSMSVSDCQASRHPSPVIKL